MSRGLLSEVYGILKSPEIFNLGWKNHNTITNLVTYATTRDNVLFFSLFLSENRDP